jgi:predicted HAD superfamily Cof-like phosphohydrolase
MVKVRGSEAQTASETPVQPELDLGLAPKPPRKVRRTTIHLGRDDVSEAMTAVAEFHITFELPMADRPQRRIDPSLAALRVELLREEFEEFVLASAESDTVALADALGDIVYVVYGTALTYGIDLDAVIREVHRSNMSKLGPDGRPVMREDGKVLKPPGYSRPDINRVLLDQPPFLFDLPE